MIVFSDFDGTLYKCDERAFENNLAAIEEFRSLGNQFCIATGRSLASLGRVFPNWQRYTDFAILNNGAICIDNQKRKIFETVFLEEVAKKIQEEVLGLGIVPTPVFVFYEDAAEKRELENNPTKVRVWLTERNGVKKVLGLLEGKDWQKRVKAYPDYNAVPVGADLVKAGVMGFVDIAPIEAGKDMAIARLVRELNIKNQLEVVAVGDGLNDVDMLKTYDGYAMADGSEAAIRVVASDHVVVSVADLLNRLCEA